MVEPLLMKRLLTILCNRSGKSANALRFFVSQVIAIEIRVGWAGFFAHHLGTVVFINKRPNLDPIKNSKEFKD